MTARTRFRAHLLALLAFVAAMAGIAAWLLHRAGIESPAADPYHVTVMLPSAGNLPDHADVRVGGVRVGQVLEQRIIGRNVAATLALERNLGPVYRNGHVQLRYKTAINEGYVDLYPGGGRAAPLADGGVLPLSRADETVQIDEVLSTFDAATRRRLKRALDGLGGGLADRGEDLNELYGATHALTADASPVFATLRRQRAAVAALVDQLGTVTRALGDRATSLQTLAVDAKTTAAAAAARDARLRELLGVLPAALSQTRTTARRLGKLSGGATPVLSNLADALQQLAPAIRELRPAAVAARATMAQLDRFTPRAQRLVARLRPFAGALTSLLPQLDDVLRQANPLSDYLAPRARDLMSVFSNGAASAQGTDSVGHVGRLNLIVNRGTLDPLLTPAQREALEKLEQAGLLSAVGGKLGLNPYPQTGSVGSPRPFDGAYPRVEAEPPVIKQR